LLIRGFKSGHYQKGSRFDFRRESSHVATVIKSLWYSGCTAIAIAICCGEASAQNPGPIHRVANTTLTLPASPPVLGYTTTNAFPSLSFQQPLALATPPKETNRLFVVEKTGRVIVLTNLANPTRTVFLDLSNKVLADGEQGLLGLAFHPGYATNRYFYVFYTLVANGRQERLSRFQTSFQNPNQAPATSEQVMITQADDFENHNGGDLHFGPDGYLYVSLGDEGNQNDAGNNSQRIDKDFFSGLLRIDVDNRPGSLRPNAHPAVSPNTYTIPADNPFVGAMDFNGKAVDPAKVRTEFYAVGLRNPWRFSFDPVTGFLYCGDVGGDLREEIDIIVKGGNYGWAYREGGVNGPKIFQAPQGFSSIPPIQQYQHGTGTNQGNSVTGGIVYRGQRLPQLTGAYIFADHESGNVWALRYDGTNTVPFQRLTRDLNIAAFGQDPRNGDVLMADHSEGRIKRLVYSPVIIGQPLPPTLADTGAFADLASLTPQPGIVPYGVNVPFWSDGARKTRWFSVPDPKAKISFSAEGNWSFPPGTIWIKHFEIELTNGVAESARRLETRLIVRDTNGVYGVTYRWGDSRTNATLVPEEGLDETFVLQNGGILRTQVWHYPSRSECLSCHTTVGGLAVGFNTAQLNGDFNYGGTTENQISALSQAGYFSTNVTGIHTMPALVSPTNQLASLEYRVRSYLAANCANCHQPGGPGLGFFDARITTPTALAGLINGKLNDVKGEAENKVIRPGWLQHSMALKRISTREAGQMPTIDSTVPDTNGIQLLSEWITTEALRIETYPAWQLANFDDPTLPQAAAQADPDNDGLVNYLEYLVGTSPVLSLNPWRISASASNGLVQVRFPHIANRGFEVQATTNLFDATSWQPLDSPDNRWFFTATTFQAVVEDVITNAAARYYRVRVFEP
jgi:glucose/arabinose dehydrogenase